MSEDLSTTVPDVRLGSLAPALDAAALPACVRDAAGRYVAVNAAFADLVGLEPARLSGKTDNALQPADVAHRVAELDALVLDSHSHLDAREVVLARDGRRTVRACRFPLYADGEPWAICVVMGPVEDPAVAGVERERLQAAAAGVTAAGPRDDGDGHAAARAQAAYDEAAKARELLAGEHEARIEAEARAREALDDLARERDVLAALRDEAARLGDSAQGHDAAARRATELEAELVAAHGAESRLQERIADLTQAHGTQLETVEREAAAALETLEQRLEELAGQRCVLEAAAASAVEERAASHARLEAAISRVAELEADLRAAHERAADLEGRVQAAHVTTLAVRADIEDERAQRRESDRALEDVSRRARELEALLLEERDKAAANLEAALAERTGGEQDDAELHRRLELAEGTRAAAVARADQAEAALAGAREELEARLANEREAQLELEARVELERRGREAAEATLREERELAAGLPPRHGPAPGVPAPYQGSPAHKGFPALPPLDVAAAQAAAMHRVTARTGDDGSVKPPPGLTGDIFASLDAALARASSKRAAARAALSTLGDALGWRSGALWSPDGDLGYGCIETWTAHMSGLEAWETMAWRTRLQDGVVLSSAETGDCAWVDTDEFLACPRSRSSSWAKMLTMVAAPVITADERVLAVLELSRPERMAYDLEVLTGITAVCTKLAERLAAVELELEEQGPRWEMAPR